MSSPVIEQTAVPAPEAQADVRDLRQDTGHDTGQDTDRSAELVEESLVEEVSIDGMCGVY